MNLPQNISPIVIKNNLEDWESLIRTPLSQRPEYKLTDTQFTYSIMAGRILGVPLVEEEYYNKLYDLSIDEQMKFHILSEELDKNITPERFQAIQEIITINQKENGLSLNRVIAFMGGKDLIPAHKDPSFYRHVQYTLIDTLKYFQEQHPKGLADSEFRRVFIDLVKWLFNHWDPMIKEVSIIKEMPRVIWYGDANKSQLYFLFFLIKVGCDVLIFNPEGKDQFAELDPEGILSAKYSYSKTMNTKPFPKEQMVQRTTVAYQASREMEHVLHHDSSNLYKPWQFRSYIPAAVTLKTTYDEMFLIVREEAFIRPNFKAASPNIMIPSVFAKVAGVSTDKKEYWDRLQELSEYELSVTIQEFPFTDTTKANYQYHYDYSLGKNGVLDADKIMGGNFWNYGQLPDDIQRGLATVISRFCESPKIKPAPGESEQDLKVFLFKQAMMIPEKFLILLQKFDFAKKVPRIVLFNTEKNGTLSRTDAVLLVLLHEIGMDVFLYSPNAQNDIELYIEDAYFSVFMLENVEFDQEFHQREKSILKRFIKNLIDK